MGNTSSGDTRQIGTRLALARAIMAGEPRDSIIARMDAPRYAAEDYYNTMEPFVKFRMRVWETPLGRALYDKKTCFGDLV